MGSDVRKPDGSWDFASGIDSGKITTVASALIPHGLKRDQLAWANNATVRGGCIAARPGWVPLCTVHPGSSLYQGGLMYDNSKFGGDPYLILSIGGSLYQVRVDTNNSVNDLSGAFGLTNPPTEPQAFFVQGEEFAVIQAGDGVTLPLFWDGQNLRRSSGLTAGVAATEFSGTSWAIPAIGGAVLVNLAGAYTGGTNDILMLDGYNYLHILYTQRKLNAVGTSGLMPRGAIISDGYTGASIGYLLYPHDFGTSSYFYMSGTITPNQFSGVSWNVPAIGTPVKVTLGAPYTGGTNVDINIDGYTYRQILYTQRKSHTNGTNAVMPYGSAITYRNPPGGSLGTLLADHNFNVADYFYITGGPISNEWSGVTMTVPAIGNVVKVTLASPYTGATNDVFYIDGYRYKHILYSQRKSNIAGDSVSMMPEGSGYVYTKTGVLIGTLLCAKDFSSAGYFYATGTITANEILTGGSWTVPAIGGNVLVTLHANYSGTTNEVFSINGYGYQHLDYRNTLTITVAGDGTLYAPGTTLYQSPFWNTIGHLIYGAIPSSLGTLYHDGLYTSTGDALKLDSGTSFNVANGNALANPGAANKVWLHNLNDSRVGTSITITDAFITVGGYSHSGGKEDSLPVPTGNDIYLLNLDDPRSGTALTLPDGYVVVTSGGTTSQVAATNANLAGPGANDVWLLNINDTRSGAITVGQSYLKIQDGGGGPISYASVTDSDLAAPVGNQIWLLNLDDPRNPATLHMPATVTAQIELPAGTCMDYYMGRIWYAQNRAYMAGDIVKGDAGATIYQKRDSVLKVTENPLALAGDGFLVPTTSGTIHALKHAANLDTTLGQSHLFIFTPNSVYSLDVPVTRADWINTTDPKQTVAMTNGSVGERCVATMNGDLFYQGKSGIWSLIVARRDFAQWGNRPISRNINRLLRFNDQSLMWAASGVEFDNRMLQLALPYQSDVGVAFKAMSVLDFDIVSSIQETLQPAWDGMWEGLDYLQLFEGNFSGIQRCFGVVRAANGSIQVWELTRTTRTDNVDNRVQWYFETPAWTWGKEYELKKLDGCELWIDKVRGQVDMDFYYRPDADACWQFWTARSFCALKTTEETTYSPVSYPEQPYGDCYKFPIVLPTPPAPTCPTCGIRPSTIGYQFQLKVMIKGYCRIRGVMPFSVPVEKGAFQGMACT